MTICSPQLGISPESGLGGEVYDREMLKALDDLGADILIVLPFGKKYPVFKHAKVYFLPTPFVYPPWLFNVLVLPYLFYLQWKYKYDVLRVHSPYFVGPAALLFKVFNPKVKIVASYLHLEPGNKFYDLVDCNLINHFSSITTISEATKDEIVKKYRVDTNKITVIPCGVDAKYRPIPKKSELVEKYLLGDKKVLLYLGQLIERKNIPFLFEVLKILPKDYVLMICGDGPMRSELEQMAPDGVIFTGPVPEDQKVDYYNLAEVFVCPSRLEGFGLSVMEAIACGRLVVVSDIPSFNEICGGRKGCSLVSFDKEKWARVILSSKQPKNNKVNGSNYSWKESARLYLKNIS